jgi:hypothetical protein
MPKEERKPDLGGSDDAAVEERVRQMMDPVDESADAPEPAAESDSAESLTAPELPVESQAKQPRKVVVTHADEEEPETVVNLDEQPKDESLLEPVADGETTDNELEVIDEVTAEESESSVDEATPESEDDASSSEPEPEPVEEISETPVEEVIEDEGTAEAVDDIVAKEGDDLLEAEDEKLAAAFDNKKPSLRSRIKGFFAAWWHNPVARWLTILALLGGLIAAIIVPPARYFVLNTAGIRSSASIRVLDESTTQPLKNVTVTINGRSGLTDTDGKVRLERLKLGPTDMTVEKRAFAKVTQHITIGWGSNPLPEVPLKPIGDQYAFVVTDFLSGKPIEKVEATSGEASAISDQEGRIKLTVDKSDAPTLDVVVHLDGYREETLKLDANTKDTQQVQLVPARKHVFISKRSGKYDVYKIDIDGKNEEKVLAGTGSEREDIVLVSHPTDEIAALVSTRDNKHNSDGYLLSELTIIDLRDNSATKIAESERVQIVDWSGSRLVYVQVASGASAANPKRHRLMGYDYKTGDNKELVATNYFNDVAMAQGKIYYAPSSTYQPENAKLYRIDATGGSKQVVYDQEVWNIFRTAYDHLVLSTPQDWYDYHIGDSKPNKIAGQPANLTGRIYVDSPDGKKSLWVDSRDGKGVLLAYQTDSKEEPVLRTQSGLSKPYRWLSDKVVVYRISTDQETADYALSLDGGEPKKIRDVTNTSGIDSWYYY